MRPPLVRLVVAVALAVASIGVAASGVFAATDLAACTLQPAEGEAPEQLGTIFESVTTTGPRDVWAVGSHVVGGVSTAYAERWDGDAWTVQDLHLPLGPTSISSLYDVTAFGPDDVWAVGTWMGDDALIRHWNGTTWSAERAPDLPGTERILTAIDGTGPDDLWAVGQQWLGDEMHGIVLHRTAAGWSVVPPPPGRAVLHDVAMLQPGVPLVAGWSIGKQGYADALLAARESGAWTREGVPAAPGRNVFLTGLAIGRPGAAWAVGFSNGGRTATPRSPCGEAATAGRRSRCPTRGARSGWRPSPPATRARSWSARCRRAGSCGRSRCATTARAGPPIPGAGDEPPDALAGVTLDGDAVWSVGRRVVTGATYGIPSARVYSCG